MASVHETFSPIPVRDLLMDSVDADLATYRVLRACAAAVQRCRKSEPPKPREEQIPAYSQGRAWKKNSSKRLQFLRLRAAANPCFALTKRRFLQTTRVFLTKDIGLMSHSLRNPLQGISHQLLGECCKPYLSRHVSVGSLECTQCDGLKGSLPKSFTDPGHCSGHKKTERVYLRCRSS